MRRTQWKLKEIEKEQDGTYALYYDTPDGSQKVCQHNSSFRGWCSAEQTLHCASTIGASHWLLANCRCLGQMLLGADHRLHAGCRQEQ